MILNAVRNNANADGHRMFLTSNEINYTKGVIQPLKRVWHAALRASLDV